MESIVQSFVEKAPGETGFDLETWVDYQHPYVAVYVWDKDTKTFKHDSFSGLGVGDTAKFMFGNYTWSDDGNTIFEVVDVMSSVHQARIRPVDDEMDYQPEQLELDLGNDEEWTAEQDEVAVGVGFDNMAHMIDMLDTGYECPLVKRGFLVLEDGRTQAVVAIMNDDAASVDTIIQLEGLNYESVMIPVPAELVVEYEETLAADIV